MFRPVEWWEGEFGSLVTNRQRVRALEVEREGWTVVGVLSFGMVLGRVEFVALCLEKGSEQAVICPEGVVHHRPVSWTPVAVG